MSLVSNERITPSASYLNTAAGGPFTAGVIAPLAATVFGVSAQTSLSALTLAVGIANFLLASVALHTCARVVLARLKL
ncbi:hypothetical protein [Methylobacterium sp. WL120]|uniref:hypothetical protein n=1 Tax=Methylobacterium sp. WL120 TaxID=2603887 RepID=UPI0011CC5C25|nr:hypothetical protein [Methylobacterium sp. WL120]TXM70293.1 hypothetical protein FV229_02710 [Methylobacterium sp. WL120]